MRRRRRAALLAISALVLAPAASRAAVLPFEGTLSFVFPFRTCLPVEEIPPDEPQCGWPLLFEDQEAGVADVELTAGGDLVSIGLAGGLFHMTGTRYVYDTTGGLFPLHSIAAAGSNQAGTLGPGGGVLPLAGLLRFCLFGACAGGAAGNLSVPLEAIGGSANVIRSGSVVNVTAVAAPWTTGVITAGETQASGSSAPGVLNLVTPISISSNLGAYATVDFGYARLVLHYVPEPTVAALLALGLATLAFAGRRAR